MQSLKVRGPFGSLDFQPLLVLGPLQKLLLPFIFRGSVPLLRIVTVFLNQTLKVYLVNRLWGHPCPPYRDDMVYGRSLIGINHHVNVWIPWAMVRQSLGSSQVVVR